MPERGAILLGIARAAIGEQLGVPLACDLAAPWLNQPAATFVTLRKEDALRGCIGSLEPRRRLVDDVRENAVAAAFRDPRFPPLAKEELGHVTIEVSELAAAVPMVVAGEADAIRQLRPGRDGVILEHGPHRGTFLPQVWATLPDPAQFLHHLKIKAGLPADFWAPEVKLSRYTVTKWKEG